MRGSLPLLFNPVLPPSTARLRLLTYPMALAQPHASVPLIQPTIDGTHDGRNGATVSLRTQARMHGTADSTMATAGDSSQNNSVMDSPRWLRNPDELCVAALRRSRDVNKINSYVATYKFDDPQWAPLLLPEVTLRPQVNSTGDKPNGGNEAAADVVSVGPSVSATPESTPPPPPSSSSSSPYSCHADCVSISHNKMIMLECMSRHVNFSLRHIVQKGHGIYLIYHAQHSILQPKGLVEQSFVTCSFGIRGERLRTDIVHVGPIDAADVMELQPSEGHDHPRCCFNLYQKSDVRRGVIAVSQVEGYGTWFQRKPMLWQRSRRIGALQSQLGAFAYDLVDPHEVGKWRDCEVSLLAPHMRFFRNGLNGAEAVGIIASSQVAQQRRLYLGEFEAPAITALDAVQQLAHASALRCKLVTPVVDPNGVGGTGSGSLGDENMDKHIDMETLLPLSWATRTPPPYVPLEADLPFKLQMSRPTVFAESHQQNQAYPTGGTVGSPFVRGAPMMMFEYNMHQGVDHYVYDDAPSARPMKWWSQKSNMPYSGYMYFARSGLVDRFTPSEDIPNPLEPTSKRKPLHAVVPPTKVVQERLRKYRRKQQEGHKQRRRASSGSGVSNEPDAVNRQESVSRGTCE
ncbi:hypothetical protein, conserved [Trypanosoma brucei brucei TREU927]|uniref:Uncharacterized protein n=1 Tax=Trypanosoma brucei brucei (strain 927/4 GUTat10.1) TaxID=185431 RepID=Q57ZP1_TRYB2|nr:hypothetical protein, conserved [Trypanosoma brucei brucei TREU927]AAX79125.1 hypothetical protein, conserved [Trypanosoma brucei]AAZ11287.1 hypothetical protein, conserved [Trypanosoma brucei brucei TREU927]